MDLRSTCVSFGHPLASTCVDFCVGRAQIWMEVDASFLPPSASRHKLITSNLLLRKRINQLYAWNLQLFVTWEPTCESVWPPFASPYASSGFANLSRLASPLARASICTQLKSYLLQFIIKRSVFTKYKYENATQVLSIFYLVVFVVRFKYYQTIRHK